MYCKMIPASSGILAEKVNKRCDFIWSYTRTFTPFDHHSAKGNENPSANRHPPLSPPPQKKKNKINKIRLFASPSLVFHTKLTYQNWNAKKHSIWKVIKLLPPVSASTKICNFHVLTDSEHKFHKEGIEDWSPMGFYVQYWWLGIHWVGFQLLGT